MFVPLASPTRVPRAAYRVDDSHDVVSAMRPLVASAQPAVVFTSLAALCVPTLSDECHVVIEEEGHVGYRIMYPVTDPGGGPAALGEEYVARAGGSTQLLGEHTVRTPILPAPLSGERAYRGVVVHRWRTGRHPTHTDAALAQLVVERAVAAVHQERLTSHLDRQRRTTGNPARALAANREIGAAIAILMASNPITHVQAFELLRIASQYSHRTLRDLAVEVVHTGALNVPPPTHPATPDPLTVVGRERVGAGPA